MSVYMYTCTYETYYGVADHAIHNQQVRSWNSDFKTGENEMAHECLRTIQRERGKDVSSRCDEYIAKERMPSLYSRRAPFDPEARR